MDTQPTSANTLSVFSDKPDTLLSEQSVSGVNDSHETRQSRTPLFLQLWSDKPTCSLESRRCPKWWGWFQPDQLRPENELTSKLRNNLLPVIGFIELANAGDFPANVWNESPLPTLAIVLMAVGGTLALSMLPFVAWDAVLSWQNIRALRAERRCLHRLKLRKEKEFNHETVRSVNCLLNVNFREQGTEWVDRFGMDTIMGFGALIVGVGTYMAIAGANPRIHLASDLLTGYIGNSPCALYGLVNLAWAIWVWLRAGKHTSAPCKVSNHKIEKLLQRRAKEFRIHSLLSGMAGIVAGAASLMTYTHWEAYIVLAVCLVLSVVLNFFWRHRLGYDRPLFRDGQDLGFSEDDIMTALQHVTEMRAKTEPFKLNPRASLSDIMEFLRLHNLFEDFCLKCCSKNMTASIPPGNKIDVEELLCFAAGDKTRTLRIRNAAEAVVKRAAPSCFAYQERWLLETLGCYRTIPVDSEPPMAPRLSVGIDSSRRMGCSGSWNTRPSQSSRNSSPYEHAKTVGLCDKDSKSSMPLAKELDGSEDIV